MKTLLALLPLLFLPACFLRQAGVNQPLRHELVQDIKPGMSAALVVEKMGAPVEVVQLGKRSAYLYSYSVEKGTGAYFLLFALYNEDTREDRVWFFFDEKQILSHIGSTFQSHRSSFGTSPDYGDDANKEADGERGLK